MTNKPLRFIAAIVSVSLAVGPAFGQAPGPAPVPPVENAEAAGFNSEQLDALLAPIALYPDALLTQVLMASTYPLQIVAASRWLASGSNAALKGDDLAKALAAETWDPSVKSLVPFPQILDAMNQKLDWTQQLGFAVADQQAAVLESVQRLRAQAQQAGTLKTTAEQVVTTEAAVIAPGAPTQPPVIVIQPADPQIVHVPVYAPSQAFGPWPYPATPPVYFPPPPGYAVGNAVVSGLAFAAGVAVVGSLWGWATPRWGGYGRYGGGINVNANRYNRITVNNVNRANLNGDRWRASANGPGRLAGRPPGGPVGLPSRGNGLGPNAIGRPSVRVPVNAVNRPNIGQGGGAGNRPGIGQGGGAGNRPGIGQGGGAGNRPGIGQGGGAGNRPGIGQGGGPGNRPGIGQGGGAGNRPGIGQGGGAGNRPGLGQGGGVGNRPNINRPSTGQGGALGGVRDGSRAGQFQQRGAQSRNMQSRNIQQARPAGVQRAGGGQRAAGGGGHRGGGGGGQRGGGRAGGRGR